MNEKEAITRLEEIIRRYGDNPEVAHSHADDILCELLEELGYTVLAAHGGREAVEIYQEHGDSIDLVILDMIMPDMGGGETFDRLKEINPGVRVLLSSGYSIDGQAQEIMARGCDGFIQKPFRIEELSQKIREIVKEKHS